MTATNPDVALLDPDEAQIHAPPTPEQEAEAKAKERETAEYLDFKEAKTFLQELERGFGRQATIAKENRERRKIDVNVEALRKSGDIAPSDLLIPMRLIDENISREKPAFIAYLQNSRRLAIFADIRNPQVKHDELESAFTRGMQYNDWLIAHHKTIDGSQLHGWDWYEVLYDESKPLHCGVEHVGNDRLEFSLDAEDIQNNSRISRVFQWTRAQLDAAVRKYGFDKKQVDALKNFNQQTSPANAGSVKDHVYVVKKGYCKIDGVVHVAWYSLDACDDWLLAPRKFYNGVDEQVEVTVPQPPIQAPQFDVFGNVVGMQEIPQPPIVQMEWQPTDEYEYPVVLLPFEETEQKEIAIRKGHAFKDKYHQEAKTAGASNYINQQHRASWLLAAKAENDGKPASELQNIELKDRAILPFKVEWAKIPSPDPSALQGMQFFDTQNAQANGQMSFASMNKSAGARTTAKEIDAAQQETALLSSVSVALFSAAERRVYTNAWRIVQSQAMQDKIEFFGETVETQAPNGEVIEDFVNNKEVIGRAYDIRPAGDTDVIKRQEQVQSMMEFWPVVRSTPIAGEFLGELLKLKFGEKGEIWAKNLMAGDVKAMLLQQYMDVLGAMLADPSEIASVGPQELASLQQLLTQTQQALVPPNTNAGSQPQPKQASGTGNNNSNASAVATHAGNGSGDSGPQTPTTASPQ